MPTTFATRIDGLVLTPEGQVYAVPTDWSARERLAYLAGIAEARRDARLKAEREAFRRMVVGSQARTRVRALFADLGAVALTAGVCAGGLAFALFVVCRALEILS